MYFFYWIIIYLLYYFLLYYLALSYFLICVFCFRQVTLLICFYCNGPTHWSEVSHVGLKRLSVSAGSSLSSPSSRRTPSTTRWAAASSSPTTDELWPLDIQRENYRSDLGTEEDFPPQRVKRFDIFPNMFCEGQLRRFSRWVKAAHQVALQWPSSCAAKANDVLSVP